MSEFLPDPKQRLSYFQEYSALAMKLNTEELGNCISQQLLELCSQGKGLTPKLYQRLEQ